MIGIPVFAGFSAKLFFGMAGIYSGSNARMIVIMLVLAISSVLNALYFLRTAIRIYTRPENMEEAKPVPEPNKAEYTIPMVFLAAANISMGLFSWIYIGLIQNGLVMFG